MVTFHSLTDVIFVRKLQYLFSPLSEEIDCGRKYGKLKKMHTEPPKIIICTIEEFEYAVQF